MSLAGRSIRKVNARSPISCGILRRNHHSFVANHLAVESTSTYSTSRQPPNLHHQQRRNFAKGDESLALKKQTPSGKKTQAASTGPSEEAIAGNKTYKMVVDALDAPVTRPPPASKEEMDRRHKVGRDYVIGCFQSHNALEHDLACKIRLKNHAVKMLPKNSVIRKAAMEVDDEGPPKWRHIPVLTPPIPGFDPDDFAEEAAKKN